MIPADPQQLPDDVDALKAMIAAAHAQKASADQERLALEAEIAELKLINATADERIARLTSIIAMLQRAQYGTRSERLRHDLLDDEQMAFVFDEIETGIGEIEAGLYQHPGVEEVAVIGLPDPKWIEIVAAAVVPRKHASINEKELVSYCKERLAGFKCPKKIIILDKLPKNPSGKILKRELKKRYAK